MGLDANKDIAKGENIIENNNIAYKNMVEAEKQNGFNKGEGNSNSGEQYERL